MQGALLLIPYYISWHYTLGIKNLYGIWVNFIVFSFNFFSIKTLLLTLFSPFQRLQERYQGGWHPEDFIGTIVVNLMMRIIGFFVRSFTIILGLAFFVAIFVGGIIFLVLWLLLPILLVYFFIISFRPLFNI